MAIIDKAAAISMIQAYTGQGLPSHFIQANGQKINGYVFNRTEVLSLITANATNNLYVMLGLKTSSDSNIGTYITPIIGKIINGKIDDSQLVIADNPNITPLNIDPAPVVPNGTGAGGTGYPITVQDAQRMIDYHLIGSKPLDLFNENEQKIKAFNLKTMDLNFLLNSDNGGAFLLMPALRDQSYTGASITKKHITFIFSWLSGNQVCTPSLYDYCLPCPSACSTF